jgi:hypothetical protein
VESVSFPRSQPRQLSASRVFSSDFVRAFSIFAEKFRFLSDEDYLALSRVFKPDQQYMIEQVRAASLVDITEVWRAPNRGCAQPKGWRCAITAG